MHNLKVFLLTLSFLVSYSYCEILGIHERMTRLKARSEAEKADILRKCLVSMGTSKKKFFERNSGSTYNDLNFQWNLLNGLVKPMGYIRAENTDDVSNAIKCCRLSGIRLVPRGGGHNYIKLGFGDSRSCILDFSKMLTIKINKKELSAEIGPGNRNGRVAFILYSNGGYLTTVGICPTVGFAGFILGGGYGYYTRHFGMGCDNVIEYEMVDANGDIQIINNRTNSDLDWALRGGGCNFVGVITKFKMRIYKAPNFVVHGTYDYALKDWVKFWDAYQNLAAKAPLNKISMLTATDHEKIEIDFYKMIYDEKKPNPKMKDELENYLKEYKFPKPIKRKVIIPTYEKYCLHSAQNYSIKKLKKYEEVLKMTKHAFVGIKKVCSLFVDKLLSIAKLKELFESVKKYVPHSDFVSELNGGAINKLSRTDTAYVHRGKNIISIQIRCFFPESDGSDPAALEAMKTFYEKAKVIFESKESYQNYPDEDEKEYNQRWYGENLRRLVKIKKEYDPTNFFRSPRSIPCEAPESFFFF